MNIEELCSCGCGGLPTIADRTDAKRGCVRGERFKFLRGHRHKPQGNPIVINDVGCWIWQFGKTYGYGACYINRVRRLAHVVEWEKVNGPVPEGKELDHLCKNPSCCNPSHLEAVTHAVNIRRGKTCDRGEGL